MALQLDFLEDDKSDLDYLRDEVEEIRESTNKVRKGLFVRNAELTKKCLELQQRLEIIERHICQKDVVGL